jgi:hypothetical protein
MKMKLTRSNIRRKNELDPFIRSKMIPRPMKIIRRKDENI